MKRFYLATFAIGILSLSLNASASSNEMGRDPGVTLELGNYILYSNPSGVSSGSSCEGGKELTLDKGKLVGTFALVSDALVGQSICEIYVVPNTRFYKLELKNVDDCGSANYEATNLDIDGTLTIEIADHRYRRCDDNLVGLIVKETDLTDPRRILVNTWYGRPALSSAPVTVFP
ncbi:MAG: hypothetical protein KBD78_10925 [Oligoflexales bacterium]|nr:hypothetical protein [Oligoflexales bacterium]